MKKRLLACVLSCLLVFRLSVPAFANGAEYMEDDMGVVPESYPVEIPDDIFVNPEDYVLNVGISGSSIGLTLTFGQVAALIAGGVGIVYASTNWDALGSHLQSALNSKAEVYGQQASLLAWYAKCLSGDIKLASAPPWILNTILETCYNIHQGLSYPSNSYLGSFGMPNSGEIVRAGETYAIGMLANYNTGEISSYSTVMSSQDCYVFRTYDTWTTSDGRTMNITQYYWFFSVGNTQPYITYYPANSTSGSSQLLQNQYVGSDGLVYRYASRSGKSMSVSLSNSIQVQVAEHFLNKYYKPGAVEQDSFDPLSMCGQLYGSVPYSPTFNDVPVGESVCPDSLVGGISQAWTDQSLDAGVIELPDVLIDGTGAIIGTDSLTIGNSIATTLDKVATGELAWDDYWIDISDSVPTAKVEDSTTGDIVTRPISPDGTLQDPVVVPEYSTDPNKYSIDLKRFFPFCIPFDLYDFFCCLAADPETPKFSFSVPFLGGQMFPIDIDLSPYDDAAQTVRNLELFLFIITLATITRDKMIKG